jgi:hypothetical protein
MEIEFTAKLVDCIGTASGRVANSRSLWSELLTRAAFSQMPRELTTRSTIFQHPVITAML